MKTRRVFGTLLAVGFVAVAASCSGLRSGQQSALDRPLRIAIRGSMAWSNHLSALTYNAPFQVQTLLYETLVQRDFEGRIVPGLASAWEFSEGGRVALFTLRPGATWHDGTPVTAEDVRVHFKRWVGLPEFAWIHSSQNIQDVLAEGTDRVRVILKEPAALLPDLCAIRPCSIGGPGCLDREGEWVHPIGSGPFRFLELRESNRVYRFERVRPGAARSSAADRIDIIPVDAEQTDESAPFELFRRGEVDVMIDGWKSRIPREQVTRLQQDPELQVQTSPGSVLHYLSFRLLGPTADLELRRHVAAAVDRHELIRKVELGFADLTDSWTSATVKTWPQIAIPKPAAALPKLDRPLTLLGFDDHFRPRERALCALLAAQLTRAGLPVTVTFKSGDSYKAAVATGEYDLRTEMTWGVPYDPDMSVKARFLPPQFTRPTGAGNRYFGVDPRAEAVARRIAQTPEERDRIPLYCDLQRLLSAQALVVPLYVPQRVAVIRGRSIKLPLTHDVYRDALTALTDLP